LERNTPNAAARGSRSRFFGTMWQVVGVFLMVGGVPLPNILYSLMHQYTSGTTESSKGAPFLLNLSIPIVAVGWWCFQRGKKHKAVMASAVLARDPRPPVLYLRPFKQDPKVGANPVLRSGFLGSASHGLALITEEEQLAEVMNEIGPFVSIGRPGEKLPMLGAARMYVSDEEWKSRVVEFAAKARLVVLRAGTAPGFSWELQIIARTVPPERVIFLVPHGKKKYIEFASIANTYLPVALPADPGWISGYGSLRAVIYFDSDWTPHLQSLDVPGLEVNKGRPLVARLKAVLQPVAQRLGVVWMKPPVIRRGTPKHLLVILLILVILFVLVLLFVLWFVSGRP
jgi:hypothetical protein